MNRYHRLVRRSGGTDSQDQSWLVPILWVVIGLGSSATVWFLLRGTTHVKIPDCAYGCDMIVKKAPNWESWGLPIAMFTFAFSRAANSVLNQRLHYRVFMQHRRHDGRLKSYPRLYGKADITLDFIVVWIGSAAFGYTLLAVGALYFAVQHLRAHTGTDTI